MPISEIGSEVIQIIPEITPGFDFQKLFLDFLRNNKKVLILANIHTDRTLFQSIGEMALNGESVQNLFPKGCRVGIVMETLRYNEDGLLEGINHLLDPEERVQNEIDDLALRAAESLKYLNEQVSMDGESLIDVIPFEDDDTTKGYDNDAYLLELFLRTLKKSRNNNDISGDGSESLDLIGNRIENVKIKFTKMLQEWLEQHEKLVIIIGPKHHNELKSNITKLLTGPKANN